MPDQSVLPDIIRMYYGEGKSSIDIGRIYGHKGKTIVGFLRKNGCRTRTQKEAAMATKGRKKPPRTAEHRLHLSIAKTIEHKMNPHNSGWGSFNRGETTQETLLSEALTKSDLVFLRELKVLCPEKRVGGRRYYAIDIAFPDCKLAVEIDGNSHTINPERDIRKDAFLKSLGWKVIRFKNEDIENNLVSVIDSIKSYLD